MNQIELTEDSRGHPLARVQFAKAQAYAVLYLSDYERVQALTGNASWFLNSSGNGHRYVRVWHAPTARNVMVSRLILGVEQGAIRHQDGDPLNLRRNNLVRPRRGAV
ncbi:hypothetical protein [Bosea sp. (in: a-proteobacteria)]|jgi:hypothetical protein|uniref:hypothetical protein n=1 Tax=Bosea sp. (in: a-proteobacteria) TaxID=1871050 RepID=UPI002DDD4978|nr:hypothetical protein [Bosea sp. (in: a-proteobacteria)]HEV2509684.1 hypothetical protein [Bosea sp. (in: a-proteobacteria)]